MQNYVYSNRIQIQFVQGRTLATATAMDDTAAKGFKKFIVGALDTLKKSGAGLRLLNEIDATPHRLTFLAGGEYDDNAAAASPATDANGVARMAVNFRPFQKNLPSSAKEAKFPKDGRGQPLPANEAAASIKGYKDSVEDRRQIGLAYGLPTTPAEGGQQLAIVLRRVRDAGAIGQLKRALQQAHMSVQDLRDACLGTRKISDAEYYKLCFYLYDFLTPGAGCPTQVRIQMQAKFRAGFKDEYKATKSKWFGTDDKAWKKVAAVIVGHELVHAWRMMVGRRIVDDGYDEEIMTVGCGPFANFPLTENSIRLGLKMKTRPGYQPLSRYYSDIAATMITDPSATIDVI